MAHTIILKGDPIRKEAIANEAITPGELIAFDADMELIPHGTAGGNAQKMFAIEEDFVGDGIDTDYSTGDQVQYVVGRPGDEIYAFLEAGANVSKGDALESNGAGALQAHTAVSINEAGAATKTVYTQAIVAYAAEDKNNSAGADRVRIKVEVA